jgi:hypothetical protein
MVWLVAGCAGLILLALLIGFFTLKLIFAGVPEYYGRLFSPEHCCELLQASVRAKAAASERVIESDLNDIKSAEDPRIVRMSTGLTLVYDIEKRPGAFSHHYSMSLPGGTLTNPAGQTLLLLIAKVMEIPLAALQLQVSDKRVYHAGFVIPESHHSEFLLRQVTIPSLDQVENLRRECFELRPTLHWGRVVSNEQQS